ncbi:MAG: ParA family protein, partial [Mesorhizobium sp.]
MMTCLHINMETRSQRRKEAPVIISAAIPKGGTGKSTMLRTLASVALHRGYSVTLIDGDRRQNMN